MHEKGLLEAISAKRESRGVEFKERFDPSQSRDWAEILKDIVAIANSGGGAIVFGVDDRGSPTGADLNAVLALDPAKVTDQIHRYTGIQFADFEVHEATKAEEGVAILTIGSAQVPLVFTRPGTYPTGERSQKTAFSKGTVYFRHGAKSEPGITADLERAIDRNVRALRKEWIGGIRRVVKAPSGSNVAILPPAVKESSAPDALPIRLIDDPDAPTYQIVDPDVTHPYRCKEVIQRTQTELGTLSRFNSHDLLAIRKTYGLDERRDLIHHPKFGSRQYSEAFVEWILESIRSDGEFLTKARTAYQTRVAA